MGDEETEIDVRPASDREGGDSRNRVSASTRSAPAASDGEPADDGPASTTALADELAEISLRTTDDGLVDCRIVGVDPHGDDEIALTVALPTREPVTFTLEKPLPWSREFLFARIVEDCGYGPGDIDRLEGERIYLERTGTRPSAASNPRPRARRAHRGYGRPRDDEPGQRSNGWRLVDPATVTGSRDGVSLPVDRERAVLGIGGLSVAFMAASTVAYWTSLTPQRGFAFVVLTAIAIGCAAFQYHLPQT